MFKTVANLLLLYNEYKQIKDFFYQDQFDELNEFIDDLLIKEIREKRPYDRFKKYLPYDKNVPINISYMGSNMYAAMMPKYEYRNKFLSYLLDENITLIVQLNISKEKDYLSDCFIKEDDYGFAKVRYYLYGIRKIHFTSWPDFGIPPVEDFQKLIKLFREIRKNNELVVVHCLAGVGRTGTFILHEKFYKRIIKTKGKFLDEFLKMRSRRIGMIQTKEQFKFLMKIFNLE